MIMPILAVRDIDASVVFYTEKLGFTSSVKMEGPDGNPVFAIVELGKASFGLGIDETIPEPGATVQFMVYVPDETNIDEYYQTVQSRSVAIKEPLEDAIWGDRVFSITDPDGYWLSFAKTVATPSLEEIQAYMKGEKPA